MASVNTRAEHDQSDPDYCCESPRSKFIFQRFYENRSGLKHPREKVIDTYNCALDAAILCQGKIYVTRAYIYFYSKINKNTLFGKSTKIRLAFRDIKSIEK